MARTVKDIREFVALANRKDITSATVKKNGRVTKVKLRGSRSLYTLTEEDQSRATKLVQSLPPNLDVTTITNKAPKKDTF